MPTAIRLCPVRVSNDVRLCQLGFVPPTPPRSPIFGPGMDQRIKTRRQKQAERDAANRKRDVEALVAWLVASRR